MTWEKVLELVKLVGPYILELLKVILKTPHPTVVANLRAKGIIKSKNA